MKLKKKKKKFINQTYIHTHIYICIYKHYIDYALKRQYIYIFVKKKKKKKY